MSKLFIIEEILAAENQASQFLAKKLGRNNLLISQDTVRREMLWAHDGGVPPHFHY